MCCACPGFGTSYGLSHLHTKYPSIVYLNGRFCLLPKATITIIRLEMSHASLFFFFSLTCRRTCCKTYLLIITFPESKLMQRSPAFQQAYNHDPDVFWHLLMARAIPVQLCVFIYFPQSWRWPGWAQMATSQIWSFLRPETKATPSTCLLTPLNNMAGTVSHLQLSEYH